MKLLIISFSVLILCFHQVQLECLPSYHSCGNSDLFKCIPSDWVCDYNADCDDGSDEVMCKKKPCGLNQSKCLNSDKCIEITKICDGVSDCIDNSDEKNCSKTHKNCDKTQYDCLNSREIECISLDSVCNRSNDCSTGRNLKEDCTKNACSLKNPNHRCSHTCINKYSSYVCDCPQGMKLNEDGLTCKNIDICLDNPQICEQQCTVTTEGHICSCYTGFEEVGSSCVLSNPEAKPFLLYLSYNGIYDVILLNETAKTFKRTNMLMPVKDKLIIFDAKISSGVLEIYSSYVEKETVLSLDVFDTLNIVSKTQSAMIGRNEEFSWSTSFYSIAVDPLRNLLFWTNTNISAISVFNTSSLDKIDIITTDCYYPTNIVLDPITTKIFWIDLGNNVVLPRILMSNMDGSNKVILIKSGLRKPTSLAVDIENQKLYWTDLYPGSIKFLDLNSFANGKLEINVVFETYDFLPYSIALYENRVYWSDWHQNRVYSVHKISGRGIITVVDQNRPSTIRIVSSLMYSNLNRMSNDQKLNSSCNGIHNPCDYSCLPTSSKFVAKCFGSFHREIKSNSIWWIIIIPVALLSFGILIFKYRSTKSRRQPNIIVSATNGTVYDQVQFWDDDKHEIINDSDVVNISDTVPILETV